MPDKLGWPHSCSPQRPTFFWALALAGACTVAASPGVVFAQTTTRASVSSDGVAGNGSSTRASISADGRFVVFESKADNLVAGDTNGFEDVFLHDRQTGDMIRISVGPGGVEGDGASERAKISQDARYVVFASDAGTLVVGDVPTLDLVACPTCSGSRDVFLYDRDPNGDGTFGAAEARLTRISVSTAGVAGNAGSTRPSLSSDGRFVAFRSQATNLVAGDNNGVADIFVYDVQTGLTIRASVNDQGAEGNAKSDRPALSADGRYVAFYSDADNLVSSDANMLRDVFVRDLADQATVRVSISSTGVESNGASSRPALSSDGRYVAFRSTATNLVSGDTNTFEDVFVHDRDPDGNGVFDEGNGVTVLVSAGVGATGDGDSSSPVISADGRYVSFHSDATNLVDGDQNALRDVFLFDRETATLTRISQCSSGAGGDGASERPVITPDGRFIAYNSSASAFGGGDSNMTNDVFVLDRLASSEANDCGQPPRATSSGGACGALGFIPLFIMLILMPLLRSAGTSW